ncbi:MAG TPA: tetratricopeptide repeat protein [Candidatus Binatia bacterium]|nr:tetratricopeptide repeat protein [Candidatus Binatia bacterium]
MPSKVVGWSRGEGPSYAAINAAKIKTQCHRLALEGESKAVSDRLTNLQASYDGRVQKLAEANAALEAFAPLISKDTFAQAQAMLSCGDVLGAEHKFVEIAGTFRTIREQADVVEARALFEAGKLAEERIDWPAANAHYARAAKLQPTNWEYAQRAGILAYRMGDYATAASFAEATLDFVNSAFGPGARETATALNNLALAYQSLARYNEAEALYRQAIAIERALGEDNPGVAAIYNNLALTYQSLARYSEAEVFYRQAIAIDEKVLGKDNPGVAAIYNNLAALLQDQRKYSEAEPLYRKAIEIDEKVLGKDHPTVAIRYNNLASLLQDEGKYDQAAKLYWQATKILQTKLGSGDPNTVVARVNYDRLQQLKQEQSGTRGCTINFEGQVVCGDYGGNRRGNRIEDRDALAGATPKPNKSTDVTSAAPSSQSPSTQLAQSLGEKLRTLPAKYNRLDTLFMGTSSPVELVIQTAQQQAIDEMLKGFPGEVKATTVRMASTASAYLTGPKDMIEITLRGDPVRTVTADAPVSWIWDVRPLKPGQVQVVLELFSHVKIGADEGRAQFRVLQDTWNVEAKGLEWVKYQVAEIEPIRAFLFALITGLVGTLAFFGIKGWRGVKTRPDES